MGDLLWKLIEQAKGAKWGIVGLALGAAGLVAGDIVKWDSAEGKTLGAGAGVVVGLGALAGGAKLFVWVMGKIKGGDQPPAS